MLKIEDVPLLSIELQTDLRGTSEGATQMRKGMGGWGRVCGKGTGAVNFIWVRGDKLTHPGGSSLPLV